MATEKRLIDANEVVSIMETSLSVIDLMVENDELREIRKNHEEFINFIKRRPTVDAVEVVHGEWSTIEDDYLGLTALECSKCNQEYWFEEEPPIKIYNYCPNCGANMKGK